MTKMMASISEIFSSIQGEGPHLGERHIFVRFEGCNIGCAYCDERQKKGHPLSIEQVIKKINNLDKTKGPHQFISLTGGEPLRFVPFIKMLAPKLKRSGLKIYLETNGICYDELSDIKKWMSVIAMDVKPASVTGRESFIREHRLFLDIATKDRKQSPEIFVKMTCSEKIDRLEFKKIYKMIAEIDRHIPFILQPVSNPSGRKVRGGEMKRLSELQTEAGRWLRDVRIIPRLHKILNVR